MKHLLLLLAVCLAACTSTDKGEITGKSYHTYTGDRLPEGICRFFYYNGSVSIEFQDSCHLYSVGDKIGDRDTTRVYHVDLSGHMAPPPTRYFFVGYYAGDGSSYAYGNLFLTADGIPTRGQLEDAAYQQAKKGSNPTVLKKKHFVVTSIFEFKDSVEYNTFQNK